MIEVKYNDNGQIEYVIIDGKRKNYLDGGFNINH